MVVGTISVTISTSRSAARGWIARAAPVARCLPGRRRWLTRPADQTQSPLSVVRTHVRPCPSARRWAQMRASARTSVRTFSRVRSGCANRLGHVLGAALDLQAAQAASATSGRGDNSTAHVDAVRVRVPSLPLGMPLRSLGRRGRVALDPPPRRTLIFGKRPSRAFERASCVFCGWRRLFDDAWPVVHTCA